ncbi:hypothetical protein MBANPS3_010605 [Mucor bainieri]
MISSPNTFLFPNPAIKFDGNTSQFNATSPFSSASSTSSSFSSLPLSESATKAPAQEERIPRPLNSFMIFRLEKQKDIVDKCPGANHRDISKIISKWWKELGKLEKQWYIAEAEKRKLEHKAMYPNYKYSPKKKIGKPRAYRKRNKNEITARVFENKQSLSALLKSDMLTPSLSFTSSDDEDSIPCDPNQARECSVTNNGFSFIKMEPESSVSASNIDSSTNEFNTCLPTLPQIKVPELPECLGSTLYYPTTTSYFTVPPGAYSMPSQSTAYFHSSAAAAAAAANITRTDPLINYNIYSNYYGAPNDAFTHNSYLVGGGIPASVASNALHYITPSHYLIPSLPPLASFNTSYLYPHDSYTDNDASASTHSSDSNTVSSITPRLLTQGFSFSS